MEIVDFHPDHAAAFKALNVAWITHYFALEPKDLEVLNDPVGKVIAPGGHILLALEEGEAIGCVALMALPDGAFEVAKMAVTEAHKGRGIGRDLMAACVARARQLGATRLYLETNSGLAPALGLYRSFGFKVVEAAEPSPYARADVAMELLLEPTIRDALPGDLDALYRIALATGDSGADAAHLYRDPQLVGNLYAAPYLLLEPGFAMVAEDASGVGGYILGALDTLAFEARLEAEWWPALRHDHADPTGDPQGWSRDQIGAYQIHHPRPPPARIVDPYPSHLHINLLPRLQGRGLGQAMIDAWLARIAAAGSRGMHLGVSPANHRGLRFYRAYGLEEFRFPRPKPDPATIYFVRSLDGGV